MPEFERTQSFSRAASKTRRLRFYPLRVKCSSHHFVLTPAHSAEAHGSLRTLLMTKHNEVSPAADTEL